MKIDPTWYDIGGAVCLVYEDGDPQRLQDRVAVVEKTPRIRIRPHVNRPTDYRTPVVLDPLEDWKNWADGRKGTGPDDQRSRAWCIEALRIFGHELLPPPPMPEVSGGVKAMIFKYNTGPSAGASVRLGQGIVKIGKLPSSHLRIDDPLVSRMHAVIAVEHGEVFIIDLGSAAGTIVNGLKVNKSRLQSGDVLTLGSSQILVELVT